MNITKNIVNIVYIPLFDFLINFKRESVFVKNISRKKPASYKEGEKSKTYSVSLKSETHTEQLAFQQTEEFSRLAKERYKVEAKNSELKNGHGYDTASSTGLFGMEIQGATTIFAVNLKRILKLINEKQ